ncbi:hypothetical protein BHE74_00051383 [Ensete ventricosum]|nr:hypothetical protein BHE74_00051383 [Ensete ventricosum]RZR78755.1 hypothetical protein BHM03_00004247 [Ensete ventricosum]
MLLSISGFREHLQSFSFCWLERCDTMYRRISPPKSSASTSSLRSLLPHPPTHPYSAAHDALQGVNGKALSPYLSPEAGNKHDVRSDTMQGCQG